MSFFKTKKSKSFPISKTPSQIQTQEIKNIKHEVLLNIPSCKVHLMDEGETLELSNGFFTIFSIFEEDVCVATIIKVGDELQWPLTKDEPVVKLDSLHYLFTLPIKNGHPLSYGVTFLEKGSGNLGVLDEFLKKNAMFTCSSKSLIRKSDIDWKEFAPRIEDYNHVLAKAIAEGTGQIVKGIFKCSNAYTNQVQKGGENILIPTIENSGSTITKKKGNNTTNKSALNESLKRVRKLSKMTEKMSKSMLNGVGIASGSVMGPMVRSQAGKQFLTMVPGEVLLASLDALNKILDAAEAAEKQTLSATSGAVTRMVTQRYGENAGEATGDALATVGHCAGTAWNVFKIRKALNPASTVSSGALKAAKNIK
ncbi:senescence/dehydration-associated protein At4g35985, chloroplastic [Solanum stenotomum]|uniref:senescence/dehydration-associated protein At4g35985, chloroplastic n=1 Tax=Solanum stenotomum TaxID=172797 RepID=UPI0020CFF437|nr:senescence/dehydration-associated protein At4g35985, chloroplastic [Solanum stenotomum]